MLGAVTNLSVLSLLATRASQRVERVTAPVQARISGVSNVLPRLPDQVALSGLTNALRSVGGSVDQISRAANTLAVASQAMRKVGALLGRVRSAIATPAGDATVQSTIDSAVTQIDEVAGNARFGGRALFSGTVSVSVAGQGITLPAVSSSSLGQSIAGDEPLASITSSGFNAPMAGQTSNAIDVVARAAAQLDASLANVQRFQQQVISSAVSSVQGALAEPTPETPTVASPDRAQTTGLLFRAQAITQAANTAAAGGSPFAQNVLALLT